MTECWRRLFCCRPTGSTDDHPIEDDNTSGIPLAPAGPNTSSPPASSSQQVFGLQIITGENPAGIGIDIVAVHGLGGHPFRTWTDAKSQYFWLKDLASQLGIHTTARVFTFGYNATPFFGKSTATISDIAIKLLGDLRNARHTPELSYRPIIFICHSLGGIVVKRALSMAGPNPQFQDLRHSVSGVVFMGTPHQGSDIANTASIITNLINIASIGFTSAAVKTQLVQSLKTDCETLMDLSEGFRHETIQVITLYETRETSGLGIIVRKSSAVLNNRNESQVPCDADHHEICKFSSETDPRLQDLVKELGFMVRGAMTEDRVLALCDQDRVFLGELTAKYRFDPTKQLSDVLERKCVSTGNWIYEHETFKSWRNSPKNAILWLAGGPGSGKTVMTASLIQTLQNDYPTSSKTLILYYFIDGKEPERSNHLNLLPGLMYQILMARPNLVGGIRRMTSTDAYFSSTIEKSTKLIHSIIKDIPEIFLIVDAMDECKVSGDGHDEDKHIGGLLETLFELQHHTRCLKLFVSSRTGSNLKLESIYRQHNIPKISLTIDLVKDDIDVYLTRELKHFDRIRREGDKGRTKENEIKQEIKKTILAGAGGMFLYAFLAWSTFKHWDLGWDELGVKKMLGMLRGLAAGTNTAQTAGAATDKAVSLSAFYLNILNLLPRTEGDRGQENTKKLFQWLVTANRPLTVTELREAFILKPGHSSKASMGPIVSKEVFKRDLRGYCGSLITIDKATQTVYLYHHSIREFFLDGDHRFSFTRTEAELHDSVACLTYLSFTNHVDTNSNSRSRQEKYQDDFRLMDDNPFLEYAAVHWSYHVAQAQENAILWEQFVCWSNSDNLGLCFRIFWYFKGTYEFPSKATPLHILCFLGLEWLIRKALSQDQLPQWMSMLNNCDSRGRTPLHWAAVNGDIGIIQLLLAQGANREHTDTNDQTPLELALEYGNCPAVSSLMGDANIEIPGKWLEMASGSGHISVVKLLLTHGANANLQCDTTTFGSPLHAAAYRGHEELVGVLLAANANVNYTSEQFGSALQVAAFEGNFAIAMLLLKAGADPNCKATIYGSALQSAAYRGSDEIVEELIRRGADVMAPPSEHVGTAMYLATVAGHKKVEAILAKVGAPSKGPLTEHRQSQLDPGMQHAMDITKLSISKGDKRVLGWQMKRFRSEIREALSDRNEKKLRWVLKISEPYFILAVKMGREGYIADVVEVAMLIVQDAVESKYATGLAMVASTWTTSLLTAVNDGKACLVDRALQTCVGKLGTLLEENKRDDARNLVVAGVELYAQMCRVGNQELIKLVAKIWANAAEDLIKGTFRDEIFTIAEGYCTTWATADTQIEKDRLEVRALTTSCRELLLASAGLAAAGSTDAREVGRQFTAFFLVTIQRVFQYTNPHLKNWLLSEPPAIAITGQDVDLAAAVVTVGMEFLLLVVEDNQYHELREIFLGTSTRVLGEIVEGGLLDEAKTAIENLANDRFSAYTVSNGGGSAVDRMERNFLHVLDLVSAAGNQIPQLKAAIEKLKEDIKGYALDARLEFPPAPATNQNQTRNIASYGAFNVMSQTPRRRTNELTTPW